MERFISAVLGWGTAIVVAFWIAAFLFTYIEKMQLMH